MTEQLGSGYRRSDSILAARRVGTGHGQGYRCAADRSGDGLGCAAGEVGITLAAEKFSDP